MNTNRLITLAVSAVLISSPVFGQASQAAPAKGLDAISDSALVEEMGTRGMEALLDRYFATHQVSEQDRSTLRAIISIRQLLDPAAKIAPKARQDQVARIVSGAASIVPTLKDPRQLMQLSSVLIKEGMEQKANTMEYWGENPRSQAELRPVAELVAQVLDQCVAMAKDRAEKTAAKFGNSPSPTQIKAWQSLDELATTARYTRFMADYYRALSIDKADPKRAAVADEAIKGLEEWNTPESQVEAAVRLRIGKLQLAKGAFVEAKKTLTAVAENPNKEIVPAPTVLEQYDARYFAVVADLLAQQRDAVNTALPELDKWQLANLPQDKSVRAGAQAALSMLQYRLAAAEGDAAPDPAGREAAQKRATTVLHNLAKERPGLRGIIYEQLVKSLPDTAAVAELEPLMLQALLQRSLSELARPADEKLDAKTLDRGIQASKEILARKGRPEVDNQLVEAANVVLPQLLEKQGKDAEAVRAYLDYITAVKTDKDANRQAALNNALAAIARLKAVNPQDADADKMLDRALTVAVDQLKRNDLAYDHARRLQRDEKFAQAASIYRLVPATDSRIGLARFFLMVSLKQQRDATPDKAQKATMSAELLKLSDEISAAAKTALASATTDADKARFHVMDSRARLTAAAIAAESDPSKVLQILKDFQTVVQGSPGADDLLAEALFYRVNALMAMGRNAEATSTLLDLLKTKGGNEGAQVIFGLLKKLDADLDVARRGEDVEQTRKLLKARADLSGPLVEWSQKNPDPKIKAYTYQYMIFDAATKQQAALAEPDRVKRFAGLRQALALYQNLLSDQNIKRWQQTVDPAKADLRFGDVSVFYAIGLLNYELANYEEASAKLARLLTDRKLGMARTPVTRDGETVLEDNPQYWEATYKLYRGNVERAKDPATSNARKLTEDTRSGLKLLYIREGDGVGGQRWRQQFEELRKEIIPEFTPAAEPAIIAPAK